MVEVGKANVRILPDTRGFRKELQAKLEALEGNMEIQVPLVAVADEASAKRAAKALTRLARAEAKNNPVRLVADADTASGAQAGRNLVREAQAAVRAAGALKVQAEIQAASLANDARKAVNNASKASGKLHVSTEVKPAVLAAQAQAMTKAASVGLFLDVGTRINKAMFAAQVAALKSAGNFFGMDLLSSLRQLPQMMGMLSAATVAVGGLAGPIAAVGSAAAAALGPMLALTAAAAPAVIGAVGLAVGALAVSFKGMGAAINAADPSELADALGELPESAQQGALALRDLKQGFLDLGDGIQSAFWSNLSNIGDLEALIAPIGTALEGVAMDLGNAAAGMVSFVSAGDGLTQFNEVLDTSSGIASHMGEILGSMFQGVMAAAAAAGPVVQSIFEGWEEKAASWAEKMQQGWADGSLQTYFEQARAGAEQLGNAMSQVGGIIGGVWSAMASAGDGYLGAIGTAIEETDRWVNSDYGQSTLTSFFESMGAAVETLMPLLGQVAGIIGNTLAPAISEFIQGAGPGLSEFLDGLAQGLEQIAPQLGPLGEMFGQMASELAPVLPVLGEAFAGILEALMPVLPVLGQLAADVMPTLALAIEAFANGVSVLVQALAPLWPVLLIVAAAIFAWLSPVIAIVAAVVILIGLIAMLIPKIVEWAKSVWDSFMNMVSAAGQWLSQLWSTVSDWFQRTWESIKEKATGMWEAVKSAFSTGVNAAVNFVAALPGKVIAFFVNLAASGRAKAAEIWEGVKSAFRSGVDASVNFVRELPGKALSALGNVGSKLLASGRALIQGFIDGILGMISKVTGAVGKVVSAARDLFPFSPAKKGPFSGKGWVLYSGRSIGETFASSIADTIPQAARASQRLMAATAGNLNGYQAQTVGVSTAVARRNGAGNGSAVDTSVHIGQLVAADMSAPLREVRTMQLKAQIKAGQA